MRFSILFLFSPFKFLHLLTLIFIFETFSAQLSGAIRWRYWIQPNLRIGLKPSSISLNDIKVLMGIFVSYLSLIVSIGSGYFRIRSKIYGKITYLLLDKLQSIPVFSFLPAVTHVLYPHKAIGVEPATISLLFTAPIWI